MMPISPNDIVILNICNVGYHCIINGVDKSESINLLQNDDLTEKREILWKTKIKKNLLSHINWIYSFWKY